MAIATSCWMRPVRAGGSVVQQQQLLLLYATLLLCIMLFRCPCLSREPMLSTKSLNATLGIRVQKRGLEVFSRMAFKVVKKALEKFDGDTAVGHIKVLELKLPNFRFAPGPSARRFQLRVQGGKVKARMDKIHNFLLGVSSGGFADVSLENVNFTIPFRLGGEPGHLQLQVVDEVEVRTKKKNCALSIGRTSLGNISESFITEAVKYWTASESHHEELVVAFTNHLTSHFCEYVSSIVDKRFNGGRLPPFFGPLHIEKDSPRSPAELLEEDYDGFGMLNEDIVVNFSFPQAGNGDSALSASVNGYMDLGLLLNTSYNGTYCAMPAKENMLKWLVDKESDAYMMNIWLSQEAISCVLQSYANARLIDFTDENIVILVNECPKSEIGESEREYPTLCLKEAVVNGTRLMGECCHGPMLHTGITHTESPKAIIRERRDFVLVLSHLHSTLRRNPWRSHSEILKEKFAQYNFSMRPELGVGTDSNFYLSFGEIFNGLYKAKTRGIPVKEYLTIGVEEWYPEDKTLPVVIPIPKLMGDHWITKSRIVLCDGEIRIDADFEEDDDDEEELE